MKPIPVILTLLALLTLPLIFLGGQALLSSGGGTSSDSGGGLSLGGGSSIDSAARIELEMLRQQVEALQEQIAALNAAIRSNESEIEMLKALPRGSDPQTRPSPSVDNGTITDEYAEVVLIAQRTEVNQNLTVATPDFLESVLGRPRDALSDNCQPMTNDGLRSRLRLTDVGPIRVNMIAAAAESLGRVFDQIRAADPVLYSKINTSGSLCVRQIRGSNGRLSSHSFGTAIDLNIDGHLDNFTDGKTQLGLVILADFFREEGWIWGAGFNREDSMHFEVSRELIERWVSEGKL